MTYMRSDSPQRSTTVCDCVSGMMPVGEMVVRTATQPGAGSASSTRR
jgi:hypothetical protein